MTNTMENTIRALVAYGDTINISAFDLMGGLSMDTLSTKVETDVKNIISTNLGMPVSDSLIDEIIKVMNEGYDNYNE